VSWTIMHLARPDWDRTKSARAAAAEASNVIRITARRFTDQFCGNAFQYRKSKAKVGETLDSCLVQGISYDSSVKRSNTIPVPGTRELAQDLAATAAETDLSQADVIRQSLKLGIPALRARLGKKPRRRLSLVEHFKRLKGLELPPYLDK